MAADGNADTDRENLRRLLLIAAPLFSEPPPLPPILQPATMAELLAYLSMATGERTNRLLLLMQELPVDPARPEQGGQRITEDWLHSLRSRDCVWCFRCVNAPSLSSCELNGIPVL
jgi:hypothetical protein